MTDPTIVAAAFGAAGIIAVALVNLIGGRISRKRIEETLDTGNGSLLGATVHRMEGALEVISAQLHLNTKETLEVAAKLDKHIEEMSVQTEDYFTNVKPVVDRLRESQAKEAP